MSEQEGYAGAVYQTAVLPSNILERVIVDDSPKEILDHFWAFTGVDIRVADIKSWDFQNVLDMIEVERINYLFQYPESDWENLAIVKFHRIVKTDKDGNKVVENVPVTAVRLEKIIDSLKSKVYLKMCGAREGFDFRQVTESRSFQKMEGFPAMGAPPTVQDNGSGERKKKWGFF